MLHNTICRAAGAVAALMMLAGCGVPGGAPDSPETTAPPMAATDPPAAAISMMVSGERPPLDSPVLAALARRSGVALTVRAVPDDGYAAALQVALASANIADITEIEPAQAEPYAALFTDVRPLFARCAPTYTAWAAKESLWDMPGDSGSPVLVFAGGVDTRAIDGGWWVRNDLYRLAGDPDALFAAAAKEPGTVALSVPGGVRGLMDQVAPLFGVPAGVCRLKAGLMYGPATDAFRRALSWLADAFASGALDASFAVRTRASWRSLAALGALAATLCDFDEWEALAQQGYTLCAPPAISGKKAYLRTRPGRTIRWMALSAACASPEAAAGFIEYCFSDEGRILQNYGIEGMHAAVYDGYALRIKPWKDAGIPALREQGLLSPAMPGVRHAEESALSPGIRDAANRLRAWYLLPGDMLVETPVLQGDAARRQVILEGTLWPTAQRWWTDFITGARDPVADWDAYLAELDAAGLAEYISAWSR
jgi:hypothetical protein